MIIALIFGQFIQEMSSLLCKIKLTDICMLVLVCFPQIAENYTEYIGKAAGARGKLGILEGMRRTCIVLSSIVS